ncbi:MAG: insulinase family protein, partial [Gammaproteobacteria bacterium]|nr:insulinase family protein [Gammaproteobacteria bacterium]
YLAPGDAELDVVAELLAGGSSSPLGRALVGRGLASAVVSYQLSFELGSFFFVRAIGAGDTSAAQLMNVIAREVARFSRERFAAQKTRRAIRSLRSGVLARMAVPSTRACALASYQSPDGDVFDTSYAYHRYDDIDSDRVRRTIRRFLRPERRVAVLLESYPGAGLPYVFGVSRRPNR